MRALRWTMVTGLVAAVACSGGSLTGNNNQNNPPVTTGNVVDVGIQDFSFSPAALTIKVGTTVRWTNNGPSVHTTTSDGGAWDSKAMSAPGTTGDPYGGGMTAGSTFEYTFNTAGTYTYHCNEHPPSAYPNFTGTITVTP